VVGQSLGVAPDDVKPIPEVVPEQSVEHFEPLFALFPFFNEALQVIAHVAHRLTDWTRNFTVERFVVEFSPRDLFCLFGDRFDVHLRFAQTRLELSDLVTPIPIRNIDF
jgi:hypothetical protein